MDGKQLGGTLTATSTHSTGATQSFTFQGDWAPGQHVVTVTFLNDIYAGPGQDRNLYVDDVIYDGVDTHQSAPLYNNGSQNFTVTDTTVQ
jgi:hypothetical protein